MTGFSQKGPGGVSDDLDNQKNCRLWLDAGDLTALGDGDSVIVWYDKSISATLDSAFRDPLLTHKYTYPIYRNSPSASINGRPVVSFESGGMLGIGKWPNGSESEDLNSNPTLVTTYQQTIFIAFRTSNDVDSRQVIWEEGGGERGINTYIFDQNIYIGAYDFNASDLDYNYQTEGKVPRFGYVYKKMIVQPNTTYVLAFKYDVPTTNDLTSTGLTGTLNGQDFPVTLYQGTGPGYNCSSCPTKVGGIFTHQDPVGIGGVNQGSYNESGQIYGGNSNDPEQNFILRNTPTGTDLFQGRIAEIAYYAYALNKAEQIIVENYLAAKYFANVIANDQYVYESSYGNGVIGIGRQQVSPVIEHNISQGDNLFEISVSNMATAFTTAPQYLLVGNNNASITWTSQNTPDSASIRRLRRIWRWDQTGGTTTVSKTVRVKLNSTDIAKLPALPSGFTKYGVIIGDRNQPLPNFSADFANVIELSENSGTYTADVPILDGDYFTICVIKPNVQFRVASDFAIEGNIGTTPKVAYLDLNYKPAATSIFNVGYAFMDGSAEVSNDYTYPASSPAVFSAGNRSVAIPFNIVNDATVTNDLPVEYFTINITSVDNGLNIGARSTLTYSIYDNDPPPKVTFQTDSIAFNENAGIVTIPVKVIGTLTSGATATVEYISGSGTATENTDFEVSTPQIMSFNASTYEDDFVVTIKDDVYDEFDEYFTLRITGTTGDLGFDDTLNIETRVYIIDNDLEPSVSFVSSSSEGFESISEPQILVSLSQRSAKTIVVPFYLIGGTATNGAINSGADYDADPIGGTLIFQPGDSTQILYKDNITNTLHLTIYGNDPSPEPDETIIFQLDPDNEIENASLGLTDLHTYTIKDYTEYEWQGVAGVGKLNDNTIWMVPNRATSGSDIPNLSPRPIQIIQNDGAKTPSLTTSAAGLNNKKLLRFDGVNDYLIPGNPSEQYEGQSSLIQTAAFYDSKSIFIVFIPEKINSATPQCIFETGAQKCGMSIYIIQDKLYFQAWGWQDNSPQQGLWGLNPNGGNGNNYHSVAYTEYDGLVKDQPYVISCHYENNFSTTPTIAGLSLFVNGELVDSYNGDVRRMQSNSGSAAIGSVLWQSRFKDTSGLTFNSAGNTVPSPSQGSSSNFFQGKMGDLLYYNEPRMNFARVRIITNYLSARYNIPLVSGVQDFDLTYADNTTTANPDFNNNVAGIGQINAQIHGDSKGESELRVRNAQFNNSTAFVMWGDNGESLTNTWPVSSQPLPAGVQERSAKVWRFTANPPAGTSSADLLLRYSTAQNASAFSGDEDLLKLLVSSDPNDFSSATVYPVSFINSGHIAEFSSVPISDGMYISLGNSNKLVPLPIELLSFTARMNVGVVDLNWATASEINNDYFEIERAGSDLKWHRVSIVNGAGNSNTTLYYDEKDRNPLSGISYYRLKQVDYDGKLRYSDVVSVINTDLSTSDDVYIFPNPAISGSVYVRFPTMFAEEDATISIYSAAGLKVDETILKKGSILRELNYSNLSPGIYLVNIRMEYLNETKKLVIQ